MNQLYVGDAVEVVLQVERQQGAEPEQADDLPAPFAHRLLYRLELGPFGNQRFDALQDFTKNPLRGFAIISRQRSRCLLYTLTLGISSRHLTTLTKS